MYFFLLEINYCEIFFYKIYPQVQFVHKFFFAFSCQLSLSIFSIGNDSILNKY